MTVPISEEIDFKSKSVVRQKKDNDKAVNQKDTECLYASNDGVLKCVTQTVMNMKGQIVIQ